MTRYILVFGIVLALVLLLLVGRLLQKRYDLRYMHTYSKRNAVKRLKHFPNNAYACSKEEIYDLYDYVRWLGKASYYVTFTHLYQVKLNKKLRNKIEKTIETLFGIDKVIIAEYRAHTLMLDKEEYEKTGSTLFVICYEGALQKEIHEYSIDNDIRAETPAYDIALPKLRGKDF